VHDAGDVDVTNADEPEIMVEKTYRFAKQIVDAGQIPLLLGGEHNVPMGSVRAVAEAHAAHRQANALGNCGEGSLWL